MADRTLKSVVRKQVERVLQTRRGAAMVEYAILAALVSVVATVALTSLGTGIRTKFLALAGVL